MVFTVRVSKKAFTDKQTALKHTGGFKLGWAATDVNLTVQEIAERWLAGHSIVPAKIKQGMTVEANWITQQIFAVDVDNENGDGERACDDYYVTPEETLEISRNAGLYPAFIYSSFRSTTKHYKFRVIYVLDESVTTRELHNELTAKLYSAFMKNGYCIADTKCSDLARLYYGGNELLYMDFNAVTSLAHVRQLDLATVHNSSVLRSKRDAEGNRQCDFLPQSRMHSEVVRGATTPEMTALINGDPVKLREIICNGGDSTDISILLNMSTVHLNKNPYELIKKLPLHYVLGVPLNHTFRCIMHGHEDNHPSASVRQLDNDTYAYFCYTCYGAGKGQTFIDLIMEGTSCGIGESVEFAEKMLGSKLQTEHQIQCRRSCENILRFIRSTAFRTGKWEPLYSYMSRKKILGHYCYYVEQAAQYAPHDSMVGEGIPVFFESIRETSARMNEFSYRYCTGIDKNSVSKKRNELADLGMIGKSTNIDHPAYAKAKEYQKKSGNLHHKEFLYVPDLTENILEFALQQIDEAKKNGERANFKTRAALLTSRGEEDADRAFAQDTGNDLSKYQRDFITFMKFTVSRLTIKGWTTEEEIAEEIIRRSKFSGVKWRVGQFRPLLTNGEHYTLQVVSNELRKQLKLPDDLPTRKKIIVPIKQIDIESVIDQISGADF